MYDIRDSSRRDLARLAEGRGDPALDHRGQYHEVLDHHRTHVRRAGHDGVPPIEPFLFNRIASARTLRCGYDEVLREGGPAPGADTIRADELTDRGAWSMCRSLSAALKNGSYRRGPLRHVEIPKRPGSHETRTLKLPNLQDRVVAKATQLIVQPVVDPGLSPFAFARPERGSQHALATGLAVARRFNRWTWIVADIRKFFDQIPRQRMLRAWHTRLPGADDVVNLIGEVCRSDTRVGIPQGSSMSVLAAHVFRDQQLERPWHRRRPEFPLVSYVDDLLLPCDDPDVARAAYEELAAMATSAGVPFKGDAKSNTHNLTEGESVMYLGYQLQRRGNRLRIDIVEKAWGKLAENLVLAHDKTLPPVAAENAVTGWLAYMGPCYHDTDRDRALDWIYRLAGDHGFDDLPSRAELGDHWRNAHRNWYTLMTSESHRLDSRLRQIKHNAEKPRRISRPLILNQVGTERDVKHPVRWQSLSQR